MKKAYWMKIVIYMFSLLHLVIGECSKCEINETNCIVKCTCSNRHQDLEITHIHSISFFDATRIEITNCHNVTMYPNLFRKAYSLNSILWSDIDNLHLDGGLSLPEYIQVVEIVNVGYLNHFPAPGSRSALFHSIAKLKRFSMKNVTTIAPADGSISSFIDLPITEVNFHSVRFIGPIIKGTLEFNCTELVNFKAINCHFSNMNESSLLVNAQENVTISNCNFETVDGGAFKVFGKNVVLNENTFQYLRGQQALALKGVQHLSIYKNKFTKLGGQSTLVLAAGDHATVTMHDNQFPCGCYAEHAVLSMQRKENNTHCESEKSLGCALLKEQDCIYSNGNRDKIQITNFKVSNCPASTVSAIVNHSIRIQFVMILSLLTYYFS